MQRLLLPENLKQQLMRLIKSVHPHPTMSEAIMEAAAAAYGEVITSLIRHERNLFYYFCINILTELLVIKTIILFIFILFKRYIILA